MPNIKVKLSEATSSKKNIQGTLSSFATNINYSNSTTGVYAQDRMVLLSTNYKTIRTELNIAIKRDTDRIEKLSIDFLDIDNAASKKSTSSIGKHSKR